jgi:hypothetical protein
MDLGRWVIAVLCLAATGACSGSDESPAHDASQGGGGQDSGDGGKPESSEPDSSVSPDRSSSEEAAPRLVCVREGGAFDVIKSDGFCSPDDTDHDGVRDCDDGCPYDHDKVAPGVCGCGRPDIDTDGDGIADCMDGCPNDPNNTLNGECGCVGEPGLKPAGTACNDTACPQMAATCNGAGVCGDRSGCSPCPGGHFVVSSDNFANAYWFCGSLPPVTGPGCVVEDAGGGPAVTRAAAQSACAAKGMTLARIGSLFENEWIVQLMTSPIWIGANDLQTSGEWYWSSPTSDSDTLFWEGGPDGSRQDSFYFNWATGAPSAHSCASMNLDGFWLDTDCSQMLAYACQYRRF